MSSPDALWVAMIGAAAILIGHIVNQTFAYRLKRKEFRVQEIRSWINALERATVEKFEIPERKSGESKMAFGLRSLNSMGSSQTSSVWSLYVMHKNLMLQDELEEFEKILKDAKDAFSSQIASSIATKMFDETTEDELQNLEAFSKSTNLLAAYERLRTRSIEELYLQLRKEVGIRI